MIRRLLPPKHFFTHTLIAAGGGLLGGIFLDVMGYGLVYLPAVVMGAFYTVREVIQYRGEAGARREAEGLPRWDMWGFLGGFAGAALGAALVAAA